MTSGPNSETRPLARLPSPCMPLSQASRVNPYHCGHRDELLRPRDASGLFAMKRRGLGARQKTFIDFIAQRRL